MKQIENGVVFPSTENTILVNDDEDIYGGAHTYAIKYCKGFNNGETEYTNGWEFISFIKKHDDGTITPGIQSEQLVLMLLDRTKKLNDRFPSPQNKKMIDGLQMFLDGCRERIEDRMKRNVMGELKN